MSDALDFLGREFFKIEAKGLEELLHVESMFMTEEPMEFDISDFREFAQGRNSLQGTLIPRRELIFASLIGQRSSNLEHSTALTRPMVREDTIVFGTEDIDQAGKLIILSSAFKARSSDATVVDVSGPVTSMAFVDNYKLIFSTTHATCGLVEWLPGKLEPEAPVYWPRFHYDDVRDMDADGSKLVTCSYDGFVVLSDIECFSSQSNEHAYNQRCSLGTSVSSVGMWNSWEVLSVTCDIGAYLTLDLREGHKKRSFRAGRISPLGESHSRHGGLLDHCWTSSTSVVLGFEHTLVQVDVRTGRTLQMVEEAGKKLQNLGFDSESSTLAAFGDPECTFWNTLSGDWEQVGAYRPSHGRQTNAGAIVLGRTAAVTAADCSMVLLDMDERRAEI